MASLSEDKTLERNSSRISADLLELYREFTKSFTTESFQNNNSSDDLLMFNETSTSVITRITASDVERLLPALEELGFEVLGSMPELNFVEGFMPITSIPQLESLDEQGLLGVVSVPRPETGVGAVDSQADFVHEADRVRANLPNGFDGTGVRIGVMSDSYDRNTLDATSAAQDIASGDLPAAGVNVLQEGPAFNNNPNNPNVIDEGRAMLQLVHDVAPGSPLAFSSVFFGEADFAQQIRDLADPNIGDADILTDDIFYFDEPLFQDGVIAQAIDDVVTNRGVPYFSLAGNLTTQAYESTAFAGAADSDNLFAGTFHDFDPGPGVDTRQLITLNAGQQIIFTLQWDDPFYTAAGVNTDLDIFLVQPGTTNVLASSNNNNILNQIPNERFAFTNPSNVNPLQAEVVISLAAGPAPGRIKYVNYGANRFGQITFNEFGTNSPTVIPHAAAVNGRAVAAVNFFNQENPTGFTSAGPSTILFDPNGNPLATPDVRQTPDFAAIQATDTTFFGGDITGDGNNFPNFFGTSAAAPHAAAVAALIQEANPAFTPAQIYARLETTAQDIGVPGRDNLTGFGLINAYDAVFGAVVPASLPFAEDFENGDLPIAFETNTTGAGRIQVTTENGPIGTRHVTLDSSRDPFNSLNELILHVDTTGLPEVQLGFAQREFDDEDDPMPATFVDSVNADGVALSVDGTNWFRLVDLTGSNSTNTYQTNSINLSPFAADNGLSLGSDVQIKFQQFGNGFATPGADRGDRDGFAFDNITVTEPLKLVLAPVTIDENDSVATLTGQIKGAIPIPSFEHQLEIDFGDPNTPDVRNFVLFDDGLGGDLNPGDGIIQFAIDIDPPHQYLDDQAFADGPSPGNGTAFDLFATATVTDPNNQVASDDDFITVNNVDPIIEPSIDVKLTVIDDDDDDDLGSSDDDNDDNEGLLITIEGAFTDPGSRDVHTGEALWSDGEPTELTVGFDGFNGTFTTSRFLSEDELEDNFPEIDDDDNNFPGLDDDDIYKLGVNFTIRDDDMGDDTKSFEIFVGEEGGIFVPEIV